MGIDFLFGKTGSRDNLTQVYNREVLVEYINFLVSGGVPFTVALVDIDNFKYVNDSYGHLTGDKVLREFAARIHHAVGDAGTVGRFGGDEFIIVYPDIVEYDEVWKNCKKIGDALSSKEISVVPGLFVTVTQGVARFPENAEKYENLIDTADKALYRGKMKGRNCFIIYLPEKHANIVLKTEREKTLSSMYLHSTVFRDLTQTEKLSDGIQMLFNFLSSYYMVDHIALQIEDCFAFEKTHNLAKFKEFKPLDLELVKEYFSLNSDLFYVNHLDSLKTSNQPELMDALEEQHIHAFFCTPVDMGDGRRAIFRCAACSKRIWQYGEMDIYLTAAKVIGLLVKGGKDLQGTSKNCNFSR